jgi:hypothetical protein
MAAIDNAIAAIELREPGEHFSYRAIATQFGVFALHCREDTKAVRQARKLSKPSNKSSTHNKRRNSYGILKTSQRERCLLRGR